MRALVAATGFGLVVSPLAMLPASAATGAGLVISEVYLSGGSAGATYNKKYVELYNSTDAPIDLAGLSIQYRSSGGTAGFTGTTTLTGSVPAHNYFVVTGGTNGTAGADVPADQTGGAFNPSGTSGTLVLADGTAPLTATALPVGDSTDDAVAVDLIGYGTSNTFEKAPAPAGPGSAKSLVRNETNTDTNDNSADFAAGDPSPGAANIPAPPPEEFHGPIAAIQGTDAEKSPHEGDVATTSGVVTAAYPTGGYNGFYIQTPGTGGATDATPGASDAIFVYGSAATAAVKVGDHVEVTGPVKEFAGTTEIETDSAADVTVLTETVEAPTPLAGALPTTETAREAHEGELLAPTGPFTVTNTYTTSTYAEIGLAAGTTPLIQPTEVEDAQTGDVAGVAADNAARAITLDDGASVNYTGAGKDIPLPWLSLDNPIRVGARATFTGPVVLEFRNGIWKLQPTSQVTGDGSSVATFENTRTPKPEEVGGDLRLATFNVLNYFPTTGEEFVASGAGTCTYYQDRAGNPITNKSCTPDGPRGAANEENFLRQQAKIVAAINKLDAGIVSLEEIENSVKFGKDRDFAVANLVAALNAAAGTDTWDYAPSPAAADLPAPAEEDVIRTAFIYKPAQVELVGASTVLYDEVNFDNAREPLAQAFKPAGTPDSRAFSVIVNHFKSKGSGTDDGTGQGNANPDRIGQAEALSAFAESFAAERGTKAVFLTGDFNSYSMEDPMQVLYGDGYTQVESDTPGEETYSYSGLSGSLDHVLANDAALKMVTGADIWTINSPESVGFEYSRYNNNATNLYADGPFRASDHDPEIVGIDVPGFGLQKVQVLGTNDFHGRLTNNAFGTEAGAAVLAGAVKQLRSEDPNTVFAAAGDLIGASTFDSFIAQDKPTIDALNEAGLDVSAVGNHEFDQGYDDLLNRVMAPYDADTNPFGGAEWQYVGANVRMKATGDPAVPASWVKDFGTVQVGFVGAVTEDLPSLVSPAGIADLEVTDIVEAANATADDLRAEGADLVVLLVHEGAATTSYADAVDPATSFGRIVTGLDGDIDAIVSGHTHLAYDHAVPVQQWVDEGRAVTTRPVVSAGQYGSNLNQLVFTLDEATGEVVAKSQKILALKTGNTPNYPADAATKQVVDAAVANAAELGARPLGKIAGPFNRARIQDVKKPGQLTENRGGESTAGNLVAEVQRWATESETAGSAQIAFMNPGGLRTDMVGTGAEYPKELTYQQAAEMQPFANTLVNMDMTGTQIKTLLEQQWQRDSKGNVPSRPFLRLGVSEGFEYTYDPARAEGDRITHMWLDGTEIDPTATYSVTANSFLAAGGDNFHVFRDVAGKRDTGKIDLQAMVDYMAEFAGSTALPVDFGQRAVGVSFPAGAPESYAPGAEVTFTLSSLAMSNPEDLKDARVAVSLGDIQLGTYAVDSTIGTAPTDEYGVARVTVDLPTNAPTGATALEVTGATTGTSVLVPLRIAGLGAIAAPMTYGTDGLVEVTAAWDGPASGEVQLLDGSELIGTATLDAEGHASFVVDGLALEPGRQVLTVRYLGDGANPPAKTYVRVDVAKAAPVVTGSLERDVIKVKKGSTGVSVSVTAGEYTPTGEVGVYVDGTLTALGTLQDGTAELTIGEFDTVGRRSVVVRYLGDDYAKSAQSEPMTLTVQKAMPVVRSVFGPGKVHVHKTRPLLTVRVAALREAAAGMVVVRTAGNVVGRKQLEDGVVTFRLPRYASVGAKTVRIQYVGNATTYARSTVDSVRVLR